MKLIVAGGRDYHLTLHDIRRLESSNAITKIVSGGASGVDNDAEKWGESRGIPVRIFKADWKRYGRCAGPLRNREMADSADAVALFPGGRGTTSMYNEATKRGLEIFDYRE